MRQFYGPLLVVLAACGSGSPSSPGGYQPPAGAAVVNASMSDNNGLTPYVFAPESLTVIAPPGAPRPGPTSAPSPRSARTGTTASFTSSRG